jgi:hypothetical protein
MPASKHPLAEAMIASERKHYGWDEEREAWAERLGAAFGKSAYWRSNKAEKEQLYHELAQEIIDFVGAPLGPANEIQWWSALLKARFGGLDFWWLSPPWKQHHYEGVVREIFLAKRLLLEPPQLSAVDSPGPPVQAEAGRAEPEHELL